VVKYVIEQDSSDTEATSDEEEDTTHVNPPCNKKQKVADVGITPGSTEKAKDRTVWFHHKVGDFSAHETPQTTFNGSGGQTEFPTRKITSRLQSFLCLLDISMLLTIRDCTVQEGCRTNPNTEMAHGFVLQPAGHGMSQMHVLYTACTGSEESCQLFMLELAEELQNRLFQEKAQGEDNKQKRHEMRVSHKKITQCQVRILCNNNRSTELCVRCRRYTCGKCRKDSPWESGNY